MGVIVVAEQQVGRKQDVGKPDFTLVPWDIVGVDAGIFPAIRSLYWWYRGRTSAPEVAADMRWVYGEHQYHPKGYIAALAEVLNFGATKYDPFNWALGISSQRLYAAACRHYAALVEREEMDAESGLSHFSHLAFYGVAIAHASPDNRPGLIRVRDCADG